MPSFCLGSSHSPLTEPSTSCSVHFLYRGTFCAPLTKGDWSLTVTNVEYGASSANICAPLASERQTTLYYRSRGFVLRFAFETLRQRTDIYEASLPRDSVNSDGLPTRASRRISNRALCLLQREEESTSCLPLCLSVCLHCVSPLPRHT
jgi:hypothetical protein